MKYINTYADLATYSASTGSFSFPHVAFAVQEEQVKYDADPSSLGYNIWGTVKDGTTSMSMMINGSSVSATVNNGYFMYDWTGGTITGLTSMFYSKSNLVSVNSVDINQFINTNTIFNFANFVYDCKSLKYFNTAWLNGIKVNGLYHMFYYCQNLETIDLSMINTENFKTTGDTGCIGLFTFCNKLTKVDLSNFVINSNVPTVQMFIGCNLLTSIIANNTNQTTLEKIQGQLVSDSIASHVTITRDGFNWVYSGGQWSSTPI